jgi:hypothetical protein
MAMTLLQEGSRVNDSDGDTALLTSFINLSSVAD